VWKASCNGRDVGVHNAAPDRVGPARAGEHHDDDDWSRRASATGVGAGGRPARQRWGRRVVHAGDV
jgi:hypothetical protein